MQLAFILFCAAILGAPLPPAPGVKTTATVLRSPKDAAAQVSIAVTPGQTNAVRLHLNLPAVHDLYFHYPPKMDTAKYTWTVEVSSDLRNWAEYCENTNGMITLFPAAGEPPRFFRVKGVPK